VKGPGEPSGSRQVFSILALVLALVLMALVAYIVLAMNADEVDLAPVPQKGIVPVLTIDGPGTGDNPEFSKPQGVAFAPDGTIYVADTGNNRVCVFDENGRFLFEFGGFGVAKPAPGVMATWEPGLMNMPTGIDVAENGEVYVADFKNDQIQVFDSKGKFLRRFPDPLVRVGRGGSGYGGTGIAVTGVEVMGGLVYATDAYQVVVFTTEGEFVRQFGRPGTGLGELDRPNGLGVTRDGMIVVADSNNNRVQALASDGGPQWVTGEPIVELDERVDNEFGLPRDVAITDDGSILVVDTFEFEIVELDRTGNVINRLGERGVNPGQFNFPDAIDALGERVLIADRGNNRVQVVEIAGR